MWLVCSSSAVPSHPAPWSQMMRASLSEGWRFAALEMKFDSVAGSPLSTLPRFCSSVNEPLLTCTTFAPDQLPKLPSGASEYCGERSMNASMSRPGPLPTDAICMRFGIANGSRLLSAAT